MTEEGQNVSGFFSFNKETVIFQPTTVLRANHEYNIVITTIAEDKKGNSLLRDFEYKFYTKQDIEFPQILDINPANESNLILAPERISIIFSKAIDTVSFTRAISISPSITYVLEWDTEHFAVDIIPIKPLSEGTRYTITINTTLTDTHRNALLTTFKSTFLYGIDRNPPEAHIGWKTPENTSGLLTPDTNNSNIPSDSDFIIGFDKQILIDVIVSFIEINPLISITVTPDIISKNNALIKLNQKPEWGTNYTLKLKKGISDIFGNKTETDILFPIVFNTERHRPIIFAGGALDIISEYKLINTTTNYTSLTLDVILFDPSGHTARTTELYYAFRISNEADSISLVSAMQGISILARNFCAYISIRTINILTPADSKYDTIYALLNDNNEGKLCILKMEIDIENKDNNGFIIFTIHDNISDNLGNTMIDSINLTLNKQ